MMTVEQRLLHFITRTNWILFAIFSAVGIAFFSPDFAKGVICGGLIVTINFHLLHRSLRKSFDPSHLSSFHVVLAKYYARLIVVGIIIFILISQHYVDPLGLLVGLSVVVASIILATSREVAKMGFSGEDIYYCGLVFSMVLPVFLGLTLGLFLDRHVFHTTPRFTLVFLVFGIIIGFRSIGVVIKKIRKF